MVMLNDENAILLTQLQIDKSKLYAIKTPEEISDMKEAGRICAKILEELDEHVKPGVTTRHLNNIVADLIFNKYDVRPDRTDLEGHHFNDQQLISYSRNHIVTLGEIDDTPLKKGELFGIDLSIKKDGWCADTARNWVIGNDTSQQAWRLLAVANKAMWLGIHSIRPGVHIGTISKTVQDYVESQGFSMVKIPGITAHSIGRIHCEGMFIPFYGAEPNTGHVLQKGMTISIEPFICTSDGSGERQKNPMTTAVLNDHKALACFWEHILAVTDDGYEILDLREGETDEKNSVRHS